MCVGCSLIGIPVCTATSCGVPIHQTILNASLILTPVVGAVYYGAKLKVKKPKKPKVVPFK